MIALPIIIIILLLWNALPGVFLSGSVSYANRRVIRLQFVPVLLCTSFSAESILTLPFAAAKTSESTFTAVCGLWRQWP
ncbi:hypothetical protein GQ54DRAFT_298000 [Martensiomyces pterosporus]|nr:hypothetical protein GQ54DRAFT_298000 [Martensiomyces pterosporus]